MSIKMLDFGEIRSYDSTRGFGFVRRIMQHGGRGDVFFHIHAVKRADPVLAATLDNGQYRGLRFWFVTDRGEKGEQVNKLWFDATEIPAPLRQTVVSDLLARWKDLSSEEPPWLGEITGRLLGKDEGHRLKSARKTEIEERRLSAERKRQEELALAREAEERRRAQVEAARLASIGAEQQRLRDAQSLRAVEIQRICTERGITELIHFTRAENLASILCYGLLGRVELEKRGLRSTINDNKRLDGYLNAVCLSISFPNYKTFYQYRVNTPDAQWVVLALDPTVLWELDCAFCMENAAKNVVTRVAPSERRNPRHLAAMFGDHPSKQRAHLGLPTEYTTHPQAEVLVQNPIAPSRITKVYFPDPFEYNSWLRANAACCPQQFHVSRHYFDRRCDSDFWPLAYRPTYHDDPYAHEWY